MAVKTKANVLTLIQTVVDLLDTTRTFCSGDMTTKMDAVSAAIANGDDQPEDDAQREALDTLMNAGADLYRAAQAVVKSIHPTLGRYASSPDLGDLAANMAAFGDKLEDDAEEVEKRGFTKFTSWTAAGSETQTFAVHNDDPGGHEADIGHVETLTIRCVDDGTCEGVSEGAARYVIEGEADGDWPWEEGGSGRSGDHYHDSELTHVLSDYRFRSSCKYLRSGEKFQEASGQYNNKVSNGGIKAAWGSGTSKINSFTISSGDGDISEGTDQYVTHDRSVKIEDDCVFYQYLKTGSKKLETLKPYVLQIHRRANAALTGGTLTAKVKDDSATHATITVDLSAIADDTWAVGTAGGQTFILPATAGENLRVEIEVASMAGAGAACWVDEIVVAELYRYDGARAVGVVAGTSASRVGDSATGATTSTNAGTTQRAVNECLGTYLRHAAAADYWDDHA